jgi:hypothetical protein
VTVGQRARPYAYLLTLCLLLYLEVFMVTDHLNALISLSAFYFIIVINYY